MDPPGGWYTRRRSTVLRSTLWENTQNERMGMAHADQQVDGVISVEQLELSGGIAGPVRHRPQQTEARLDLHGLDAVLGGEEVMLPIP